jgi:hypothetical protein
MHLRRHLLPAFFMVSLVACARWTTATPPLPAKYPARRQVRVWTAAQMFQLHGVAFRNDTLIGVPFTAPPRCDSCRVFLALSAIDSMKTGGSDTGPILLAMTPIALVALLLLTMPHNIDF